MSIDGGPERGSGGKSPDKNSAKPYAPRKMAGIWEAVQKGKPGGQGMLTMHNLLVALKEIGPKILRQKQPISPDASAAQPPAQEPVAPNSSNGDLAVGNPNKDIQATVAEKERASAGGDVSNGSVERNTSATPESGVIGNLSEDDHTFLLGEIQRLREAESRGEKVPEFLGEGLNGRVYKLELGGRQVAVKVEIPRQVVLDVTSLQPAEGIPNTQQLIGAFESDGIVVTELIEGDTLPDFARKVIERGYPEEVSEEHILSLVDAVVALNERGISIDPKQWNTMYSPTSGFTLLDFNLNEDGLPKTDLGPKMGYVAGMLNALRDTVGFSSDREKTPEDDVKRLRAKLEAVVTLLTVLKKHRPELFEQYATNCRKGYEPQPPRQFTSYQPLENSLEGGLTDPQNTELYQQFRGLIGI